MLQSQRAISGPIEQDPRTPRPYLFSDGQNRLVLVCTVDVSGAPSINGTNQFPNPPIRIGITIKKLLRKHEQSQLHYRFDHLQFIR